eukprot:gene13890-18627_t
MCPAEVFDIEDIVGNGENEIVVSRPQDCTMCRECIRNEGWNERIALQRVADHFIFSVESSGCMPPEAIVQEAISILKEKALKFHSLVEEYESDT